MPRKESTTGAISAQAQQDLVSDGIENYELPKSIVTKIAKSAIPENAKLQKETVLSLVKGSTVFINYLAATAHDVALSKQHKSISASDVLKALEMIEFGDLCDMLQSELQIYRTNLKIDKSKKERADKAAAKAAAASSAPKPKGKEKASTTEPTASASAIPTQEVDQEMDEVEDEVPEVDAEPDIEGEGDEGDEIEIDEPELEEEPELEDKMAVEENELRKDMRGLDDD